MPKIIENEKDTLQTMQLLAPKLKDKEGKSRLLIDLKAVFGFIPEILIIDKVPNENNRFRISAVMPSTKLKDKKDGNSKPRKTGKSKSKQSKTNS